MQALIAIPPGQASQDYGGENAMMQNVVGVPLLSRVIATAPLRGSKPVFSKLIPAANEAQPNA
ncbi:MAG TPA: hypothetical protein VMT15_09220 [Bryobacteraceae bacterium]|nr:hypothetical protein [Bryobacteraceae bacterium]